MGRPKKAAPPVIPPAQTNDTGQDASHNTSNPPTIGRSTRSRSRATNTAPAQERQPPNAAPIQNAQQVEQATMDNIFREIADVNQGVQRILVRFGEPDGDGNGNGNNRGQVAVHGSQIIQFYIVDRVTQVLDPSSTEELRVTRPGSDDRPPPAGGNASTQTAQTVQNGRLVPRDGQRNGRSGDPGPTPPASTRGQQRQSSTGGGGSFTTGRQIPVQDAQSSSDDQLVADDGKASKDKGQLSKGKGKASKSKDNAANGNKPPSSDNKGLPVPDDQDPKNNEIAQLDNTRDNNAQQSGRKNKTDIEDETAADDVDQTTSDVNVNADAGSKFTPINDIGHENLHQDTTDMNANLHPSEKKIKTKPQASSQPHHLSQHPQPNTAAMEVPARGQPASTHNPPQPTNDLPESYKALRDEQLRRLHASGVSSKHVNDLWVPAADASFTVTYNIGFRNSIRPSRGQWEFCSTGAGSDEELASLNLEGDAYWTTYTAFPTATQVRRLRRYFQRNPEKYDGVDPTAGIGLVWVLDESQNDVGEAEEVSYDEHDSVAERDLHHEPESSAKPKPAGYMPPQDRLVAYNMTADAAEYFLSSAPKPWKTTTPAIEEDEDGNDEMEATEDLHEGESRNPVTTRPGGKWGNSWEYEDADLNTKTLYADKNPENSPHQILSGADKGRLLRKKSTAEPSSTSPSKQATGKAKSSPQSRLRGGGGSSDESFSSLKNERSPSTKTSPEATSIKRKADSDAISEDDKAAVKDEDSKEAVLRQVVQQHGIFNYDKDKSKSYLRSAPLAVKRMHLANKYANDADPEQAALYSDSSLVEHRDKRARTEESSGLSSPPDDLSGEDADMEDGDDDEMEEEETSGEESKERGN